MTTENNGQKEQKVLEYYILCNKLKDVIRTGWKDWHVTRERVESVAEHVYGVQMLAVAMYSEYEYDIDLKRVLCMLAVHELGETVIGDLTQFMISREEKKSREHKVVHDILGKLLRGSEIEELFLEFDERQTPEAKFAYSCDKLECDLQCRIYDEEGCVDLTKQKDNMTAEDPMVKELLKTGASWSEMWLSFGQKNYSYDDNFRAVSDYAMTKRMGEKEN